MRLNDGAFTGSNKQGNPYLDGIEKGIAYDIYEANTPVIKQIDGQPTITSMYRDGARELISHFSAKHGQTIMDLGSGTCIATLELLSQNPQIHVVGVEVSKGMLDVGNYKFHKADGKELKNVNDSKLQQYWDDFRKESRKYKEQVTFINADFQTIDTIEEESIDGAIANQFAHWTDIPTTFSKLHEILKPGKSIVWNSASHFYEDAQFPSLEYGFRYNHFLECVLKEISKEYTVEDYKKLSRPQHTYETIKEITEKQGFDTKQVATYLVPVDLQIFVKNHVPVVVKELGD